VRIRKLPLLIVATLASFAVFGSTEGARVEAITSGDPLACTEPQRMDVRIGTARDLRVPCGRAGYELLAPPDPAIARISSAPGAWAYHPDTAAFRVTGVAAGTTSIRLLADDHDAAQPREVTIPIRVAADVNAAPSCVIDAFVAQAARTRVVEYWCEDLDGDTLHAQVVAGSEPQLGTVEAFSTTEHGQGRAHLLHYVAGAALGTDEFAVRISDGHGGEQVVSAQATVTDQPNAAPECGDAAVEVAQDAVGAWLHGTCTDQDSGPAQLQIVTEPDHGTVSVGWRGFRYTPDPGYVGPDSFTFEGSDGDGGSHTGTFWITVGAGTVGDTLALISFGPAQVTGASDAAFAFKAFGAPTWCALDDEAFQPCTSPVKLTGLAAGTHKWTVRPGGADPGWDGPATRTFTVQPGAPVAERYQLDAGEQAGAASASALAPVAVGVQVPTRSVVTITRGATGASLPAGWTRVGESVGIDAATWATAAQPLRVTLQVHSTVIAPSVEHAQVHALQGAAPITARCAGMVASPSPCELQRRTLAGGTLEIVVLATQSASWAAGWVAAANPPADDQVDETPPDETPPAPPKIATRIAAPVSTLQRHRCPRAQQRTGVRVGSIVWCFRLHVTGRVVRSSDGVAVANQPVNVFRMVGTRQLLVAQTRTNAHGQFVLTRTVALPVSQRTSLQVANRWLGVQYRSTRLRHVPVGNFRAAAVTTVGVRR
jgi:hypothetical protein